MSNDLYKKTSRILNNIILNRISIKSAIYNDTDIVSDRNFRKIYKLVNEVMKNRALLEEISDKFYADLDVRDKELFMVFLYEIFISQQKKKIGGKLMKNIKVKYDLIKKYLIKKNSLNSNETVNSKYYSNNFISYRVNKRKCEKCNLTIKDINTEITCNQIELKYDELYILDKSKANLEKLFSFSDKGFIIFQNESSFLPVYILSRLIKSKFDKNLNFEVIDCCAAPGNKTLQLSDLFSESKVIAFEKDNNRCQLLTKRVKLYNTVQNISVMNDDFLLINPQDFPKVEVILCDPSCSGSGTLNNHYSDINNVSCCLNMAGSDLEKNEISRLSNLSGFQVKILLHAMKFPNVKIISYSTCSVFITENEYVVSKVLKKNPLFKLKDITDFNLPFHKGVIEGYENCVRTCSQCHSIDGFFIAIFERK